MIISASYKTDIPCYYGEWFMRRLAAGYCKMVNPYSGQVYRISLQPEDVDGFVFWTRNIGPFLRHLPEVEKRGFPFIIQYTITDYPRAIEPSVVDARQSVEYVRRIAADFGPKRVVWRYDPILFTSLTPRERHLERFARLAQAMAGATDEVVVSFAQIYRKSKRNMDLAAGQHGFHWEDPPDETKLSLLRELRTIAEDCSMRLTVCAQDQYLVEGVRPARCVDAERLSAVAGRFLPVEHKGHRPDCGCYRSKDIGEYDTCTQGCIYCYAVQNRALAQRRHRLHDPEGEFLFTPRGWQESGKS